MSFIELYVAIAGTIGASIAALTYFLGTGTHLEDKINRISDEKSQIISKAYLDTVEKIFERFKTNRTLTHEQEEALQNISYDRFRLNKLPNELAVIVDKMTHSVFVGISSALFMIIFAYLPTINLDLTISFTLELTVGVLMIFTFVQYLKDGLLKIDSLRKFQKMLNDIERCKTFDKLDELLD